MNEEDESKVEKTEVHEQNTQPTAIDAATALADRIDAGNAKTEELLIRQENLKAEAILGGQSEAGKAAPEPVDPEQVVKDRCNKLLEGLDMKI